MNEHATDRQLSMLIDSELSLVARQAVSAHLATCLRCASRHDQLIAVTAALRSLVPVTWSARSTAASTAIRERAQRRDLALPVTCALALAAALIVALARPVVGAGASVGQAVLAALASVAPGSTVNSVHVLVVLVFVALVFPVVSIRLARRR